MNRVIPELARPAWLLIALACLVSAGRWAGAAEPPESARSRLGPQPAQERAARERAGESGRVVVQLAPRTTPDQVAARVPGFPRDTRQPGRRPGRHVIDTGSAAAAQTLVERLTRTPGVVWVERERPGCSRPKFLPTDPAFSVQWYLHNTGQGAGSTNRDLYAEPAWDITRGTSSVVIAILDDGFDLTHPDLSARYFTNPGESGSGRETNGVDDDLNGYIDDWRGWNFADTNNNPSPVAPDDNHGTTMAGLAVASLDNGTGVAGLAGDCRLLPVRVHSDTVSQIAWAEAIEYAAQFADVISISYYITPSEAVNDAMEHALITGRSGKGCVLFAALGNDGVLRRHSTDAAAAPEVLSVSGTSWHDKRAWLGDYGPSLDLMAPAGGGGDGSATDLSRLFSTDRQGAAGYSTSNYTWQIGTSCSCPLAAAAAALVLSRDPSLSGMEVRRILEQSCDPVDGACRPYGADGKSEHNGFGRVNAWGALTATPPEPWDTYEPDDTPEAAAVITDGDFQYRALASGDDIDWARFSLTNDTTDVLLTVIGATNTWLRLFDAATNLLTEDQRGFPSFSFITNTLPRGDYFVSVQSRNAMPVTRYGLHLAVQNFLDAFEPDDSYTHARPIAFREMQFRTLYPSGDVDWATFTLPSAARVDILTLGELDGYLELSLYDTNQTRLGYNYQTNTATFLSTNLAAGSYRVSVTDIDGYPLSSYQLLVEAAVPDAYENNNTTNVATPIANGGLLTQTLVPADDVDWFTFTLTNQASVLVLTDSIDPLLDPSEGDTLLTLYREGGGLQFVAQNNDGNNFYFSAIYRKALRPAKYYIKVAGADASVTCLNYTVSLDVYEEQTGIEHFTRDGDAMALAWYGSDADARYDAQVADDLMGGTSVWITATNIEGRVGWNRWNDDGSSAVPPPNSAARRFYRIVTK